MCFNAKSYALTNADIYIGQRATRHYSHTPENTSLAGEHGMSAWREIDE